MESDIHADRLAVHLDEIAIQGYRWSPTKRFLTSVGCEGVSQLLVRTLISAKSSTD